MKNLTKSHGRKSISASIQPSDLMGETPRLKHAWQVKIVTLFPGAFPGVLAESITGRALQEGLWQLHTIDLRPFGEGKHKNVDDTPAGGGAGMVLRADVVGKALEKTQQGTPTDKAKWPVVYLSPRGKPMTQKMVQRFAKADGMTLLCGRFEGVDERVIEEFSIEEVSLGDFVLTGGEIAAQALIDATVRLIPRVLGNQASTEEESFSDGLLEHPQYTRPSVWRGREIPEMLLSGHHAKIAEWRNTQSKQLTKNRRPDLWRAYCDKHKCGDA